MFKKLILLVLIALLAIPVTTGCSSNKEQPAAPAASVATEEKPANPATSPAPATTPPTEKPSEPEKAISRVELIERIENGEYDAGDIVLLSGIVMGAGLDGKGIPPDKTSLADFIWLGPSTESPVVRIELAKEKKVKIGEKIIVKGTIASLHYTELSSGKKNLPQIYIIDAVIQ
ncbi:MAG: hypothetical protein COS25_00320 [Candidatus Nealsonbacteria bacterium CG02_land_8_20_14_3_00_37_10]|uniref:DUF5666 domain-containing protein n=1 Tax=Candidatus Nealsonbacteria bacterium CG02_land_8_20_14_3_00_37_10 TaxID=1974699 RepID=A0A2M7DA40_9BACT|nr:MAG: hypothetical protein COS25_00320 [Candidatus Nealsonbacteria bacterium CG02_land_8_20_14_3_00_37_10]